MNNIFRLTEDIDLFLRTALLLNKTASPRTVMDVEKSDRGRAAVFNRKGLVSEETISIAHPDWAKGVGAISSDSFKMVGRASIDPHHQEQMELRVKHSPSNPVTPEEYYEIFAISLNKEAEMKDYNSNPNFKYVPEGTKFWARLWTNPHHDYVQVYQKINGRMIGPKTIMDTKFQGSFLTKMHKKKDDGGRDFGEVDLIQDVKLPTYMESKKALQTDKKNPSGERKDGRDYEIGTGKFEEFQLDNYLISFITESPEKLPNKYKGGELKIDGTDQVFKISDIGENGKIIIDLGVHESITSKESDDERGDALLSLYELLLDMAEVKYQLSDLRTVTAIAKDKAAAAEKAAKAEAEAAEKDAKEEAEAIANAPEYSYLAAIINLKGESGRKEVFKRLGYSSSKSEAESEISKFYKGRTFNNFSDEQKPMYKGFVFKFEVDKKKPKKPIKATVTDDQLIYILHNSPMESDRLYRKFVTLANKKIFNLIKLANRIQQKHLR